MLKNVLIGTNVAYTNKTNPSALLEGEIGVYSLDNGVYTLITGAISAAQGLLPIVIAQGVPSGNSIKMFTIQPKEKKAYLNTAYVAPVPHVIVAGYDGVNSVYTIVGGVAGSYSFQAQNLTSGMAPFPSISVDTYYNTTLAASPINIACDTVKQFNNQTTLNRGNTMPDTVFATAEILSSGTSAATASTPTATVTNGSNTVVLTGASASIIAGNYLKFGGTTATNLPIYKIVDVSGTTVTLDSPYVNPSLAYGASVSGLTTGFSTSAQVASASIGIRVTAFGKVFNGSDVLEPMPNKILNVTLSENLTGTVKQDNKSITKEYTAAAGTQTTGVYTEGAGTYPQIFKKELVAAGYLGFTNRSLFKDSFPLYSVKTTNYITMGIEYGTSRQDFTGFGLKAGQTLSAIIAVHKDASQATTLNTILASTNW